MVYKEMNEGFVFIFCLLVCSILILGSFVWLLSSLINVPWLSRLPRFEDLIMPKNKKARQFEVDIIKLIGYTMICNQIYINLMRQTMVGISIYFPIRAIVDKLKDKIEVQVLLEDKQGKIIGKTLKLDESESEYKYLKNSLFFFKQGENAEIVHIEDNYTKIIINVFIIFDHEMYLTTFSDKFPQEFVNDITPETLYPKDYGDNVNWFLEGGQPLEQEARYLLDDSILVKDYIERKRKKGA
ncbi:hypothetical protein [Peribacillus muralis]|uniref:hypothetical protein n=1 Tax=Peribacillus muralis TaxID=264697 RepID=UPI00367188B9